MRRFPRTELGDLVDLLAAFSFTRQVIGVHLHHSWRPRQADFTGLASIQEMWRQHVDLHGLSDIAQHLTIDPEGGIWPGRNFNRAPASARGFNGNDRAGPFMVVMVGDFDHGRETPTEAQMQATLGAIRAVQARFDLPAGALQLHGDLTGAPCPGAFERARLVDDLSRTTPPRPRDAAEGAFPAAMTRQHEILDALDAAAGPSEDVAGAELPHGPGPGPGARDAAAEARDLSEYRDHWINLDFGAFSDDGALTTSRADVERIFKERLPAEIARAQARGRKLDLLFYAHGGLVPEDVAIGHMTAQTRTWQDNDVYPIFFVWETGFWRSIGQLLPGAGQRAARNVYADRLLEEAARRLGGVPIWGAMKANAQRGNSPEGGAFEAVTLLKGLIDGHGEGLRIHAVGHSAGSIFHAFFLANLLREKKYHVETYALLAPAIRTDLFKALTLPLIRGGRIGETLIYTMNDRRERSRDPSMGPYGKSLLYLVRGGLEPEREADLLGLEISLRRDPDLARTFGLNGHPVGAHRVVFSGDPGSDGAAAQDLGLASDARTHGGFDDDVMTMTSVLRRVTGRTGGEPVTPFRPSQSRAQTGVDADLSAYLPPDLLAALGAFAPAPAPGTGAETAPAPQAPPPDRTQNPAPDPAPGPSPARAGRQRALCIGIDDYLAINPLGGCRNDAGRWREALEGLGFEAVTMAQEEATADGMIRRIGDFVAEARAGDTFVLQFSGHGTQFRDLSGDETGGPGADDAMDEALCAIDCDTESGGIVLDDHLRNLMNGIDPGAAFVCFLDSCHSGTSTRARLAGRMMARARGDVRVRACPPTQTMTAAYARIAPTVPRADPTAPMREVVFSACLPNQYAYERDGQGDFTRFALQALARGGARPTNSGFLDAIIREFGQTGAQMPYLDCAAPARDRPLALGRWA